MYACLDQCILFKGLTSQQIIELLNQVNYKNYYYDKNETLVCSDDEVRNLFIILEGSVRGEMTDFSGKIIKIEDIESPRMLAPAFLFGMNNRYPVDIVTNSKVTVLGIPRDSFLELCNRQIKLHQN
ncbi:MAG: cyclic nucleotide-binding domain-containing protein [Bacteroidales bacterium]|nr:cyclic nucleotide-binding domain-containing protein [Bacteroidales bacterium]MBN2821133.1 cyclic nucleotide-binding domain-containing protein [Bacteroidales bacterium]